MVRSLFFVLCCLVLSVPSQAQDQPRDLEEPALRIRAVGDLMMGTAFPDSSYLPPHDGERYLDAVEAWMRDADLTFANLEGPFVDGGESQKCRPNSPCYAFRTPTRYGRFLVEAGIDLASLANNHANDFEERGMESTTQLLDSLGIAWSGPPGTVASLDTLGMEVGMVAFHSSPSGNHLNDSLLVRRLISRMDRTHDVVLVSFHGGAEGSDALHLPDEREFFYGEDRGYLRQFAREAVRAGADLVIGHGPHVPRAIEFYQDRLIAYSLGNFGTYGRFALGGPLGVGLVLDVELDREGRFVTGRILPTRQVRAGIPEPDPAREAVTLIDRLSRADLRHSGAIVLPGGRIVSPWGVQRLEPILPGLRSDEVHPEAFATMLPVPQAELQGVK